jgi:hypothetical protein
MIKGDLVRLSRLINSDGSEVVKVGIVIGYEKWEKIAEVLMQDTGLVMRIPARQLEILKRAPQNSELLKKLAESKEKA